MLIVFEGVDGSGKSTQLRMLADALRGQGLEVVETREPGGSPSLGKPLRDLVLHSEADFGRRAEALLFAADRAAHVHEVVRPALERGAMVLCDRFVDSTLAYQGAGRGLEEADLLALCEFATGGLQPDLVVVCDLPEDVALARQRERGEADRMEKANLGRHVRQLLLRRAAEFPFRYRVVDADGTPEQVHARVLAALAPTAALAS